MSGSHRRSPPSTTDYLSGRHRRPTPTVRTTPPRSSFRVSSSLTSVCSSRAVGPAGALRSPSLEPSSPERAAQTRPSPPHRCPTTSVRPRLSLLARHDSLAPLHLSPQTTPPLASRAVDCGHAATRAPSAVTARRVRRARHAELGQPG
jgi:hypothetical protein